MGTSFSHLLRIIIPLHWASKHGPGLILGLFHKTSACEENKPGRHVCVLRAYQSGRFREVNLTSIPVFSCKPGVNTHWYYQIDAWIFGARFGHPARGQAPADAIDFGPDFVMLGLTIRPDGKRVEKMSIAWRIFC